MVTATQSLIQHSHDADPPTNFASFGRDPVERLVAGSYW